MRLVVLLALGACADPVVEMSFLMPAADRGGNFDTSCVTAVDVYTTGTSYPGNPEDYEMTCVQLAGGAASFGAVRNAMTGKIDVPIPSTGLASVEVFGRKGTCANDASIPPGELVFYAGSRYTGDEQIVLPMEAVSACDSTATVLVRPVDLLALTTGAVKGDCNLAKAMDGATSGADVGTLMPTITDGAVFYNGLAGAALVGGVATIDGALTTVGPKACLAVSSGDARFGSVSCVDAAAPKVCATGTELEAPGLDGNIALASLDSARKAKFPGVVFGLVVNAQKQPIAGALVEVDPKFGEVVYVEPATSKLNATGGSATGASGLFIVYTKGPTPVKVSSGGLSRIQTMGAISDAPGAALVMLR